MFSLKKIALFCQDKYPELGILLLEKICYILYGREINKGDARQQTNVFFSDVHTSRSAACVCIF